MTNAISAVEKGMTIRQASECFDVPKSSLHDRVAGKVQHGSRPGPQSYLTLEEEGELVNFLTKCAEIGYAHSLPQVLALVQQIVDHKGIATTVSYGWWQRFCQRNKGISLRTAASLSRVRAMATDPKTFERYFDILEDTLKDNGIYNNPTRLYNCDETGLCLSPKGLKVVAKRGASCVNAISGDTKNQITVLACTSASGAAIPPMVIFKRKTLNPELTSGEVPGTIYGLSSKGWINRELFLDWFHHHFLLCVPSVRPLLLIMDGHSSHYSPDVIRVAAEQKVILFTLPPHTTHATQPLDRGCFSPLKVSWRQVCHEFYTSHPGQVVTQYDFSSLFAETWKRAMTPKNIISGFRVTGVCPFDRSKVQGAIPASPPARSHMFKPEMLSKRTGLAYIPLYSPVGERVRSKDTLNSQLVDVSFTSSENDSEIQVPRRSYSETNLSNYNLDFQKSTSISQFLNQPAHLNKLPTKHPKSAGKVLTSLENRIAMEEREEKKKQELKEKELRRKEKQWKKDQQVRDKELRQAERDKATQGKEVTARQGKCIHCMGVMNG